MATIISSSDLFSKAAAFIIDELTAPEPKDLQKLLDEASMRFNLSPNDSEALLHILAEEKKKSSHS